ncbi:hypothetical protein Tsubulata_047956 [Turnera subulata]|uniref:Cytochrome P450 n=1 Tax=Turnera subulata TaxID=218843 RepID=A0A9Q0JKB5_9ROSI|nr:hypothetical protein Tsubulata_047956 [Turnera subulata]
MLSPLVKVCISTTSVLLVVPVVTVSVITFEAWYLISYIREWILKEQRPPIVGSSIKLLLNFNRLFDYQTSVARKHSTFRIVTPPRSQIYTADPVNVEHILKSNFSNYVKGAYNQAIVKDLFGDGIFAADGDMWRHQRKLASYEFSTKVLRDFSSAVFRANAAKLAAKVAIAAAASKSIEFQEMLRKSTLESMFKVGFGVELNVLSGSDEFASCFNEAFDDSNSIVFRRYLDFLWEVKKFLNVGLEASLKRNMRVIDDFIYKLIHHKREQMKKAEVDGGKEDILSRFILESEKDPENMSDKYLRDITFNFMIAGKDTTANTLTWFFFMLCKHPLLQEKVFMEVVGAAGVKGMIPTEKFSELLTEEAIAKMHYLHAALTETLRLFPSVPVDGKCAADDDVLPDGLKIKKGDGVNYMAYAMGRMTNIWGEDAEEFRPDRWLQNGIFRPESPYKFPAFHGGPRICLGKEFAYRQMKILAAVLLYSFRFKLVDEKKEAAYRTMFTLQLDKGLPLHVFPRL